MQRICAWCGAPVGAEASDPAGPISHGICTACVERTIGRVGTPVARFIESLEHPVLLLDGSLEVVGASPSMEVRFPASRDAGSGMAAVFECGEAETREDCGRTIHCSGCAIRRAVVHTIETGESQVRVPATLTREAADSVEDVCMFITTEKLGERVLLRVESVQ